MTEALNQCIMFSFSLKVTLTRKPSIVDDKKCLATGDPHMITFDGGYVISPKVICLLQHICIEIAPRICKMIINNNFENTKAGY